MIHSDLKIQRNIATTCKRYKGHSDKIRENLLGSSIVWLNFRLAILCGKHRRASHQIQSINLCPTKTARLMQSIHLKNLSQLNCEMVFVSNVVYSIHFVTTKRQTNFVIMILSVLVVVNWRLMFQNGRAMQINAIESNARYNMNHIRRNAFRTYLIRNMFLWRSWTASMHDRITRLWLLWQILWLWQTKRISFTFGT